MLDESIIITIRVQEEEEEEEVLVDAIFFPPPPPSKKSGFVNEGEGGDRGDKPSGKLEGDLKKRRKR